MGIRALVLGSLLVAWSASTAAAQEAVDDSLAVAVPAEAVAVPAEAVAVPAEAVTTSAEAVAAPAEAVAAPAEPAAEASADSLDVTEVEEPALEFRTNVPWARMVLRGRQSIAGRSPMRVPGPLLGNFWLEAHGPGVELQRGRVRFALDDAGSRVFSYGDIPFRQNLMRSVVFPGMSQLRTRQELKGAALASLGAAGIGLAVWAQNDLRSAEDAVETLTARLDATTDPDTLAIARESLHDARAEESHLRDRRDLMVKATGIVWGVSMIDALVFTPRFRTQDVDSTSVTLSLRRASRGRAVLRSAVFPGLGQEYSGDRARGLWVAGGAVLAASHLIWRQDELLREEAGLREAEARLADSPGPEALARRDGRLRDLADAEDDRDLAMWIAAGYWGLSLLDTALSFQEPWGEIPVEGAGSGTVGWTVDPLRGGLAARVRF